MSQEAYKTFNTHPDLRKHDVLFVGGSGAATLTHGRGITLTYVGSGVYTLTWKENPGRFISLNDGFQATTMTDLKQYTAVWGAWNTTTHAIQVTVFNASGTATDLAALQWLGATLSFESAGTGV